MHAYAHTHTPPWSFARLLYIPDNKTCRRSPPSQPPVNPSHGAAHRPTPKPYHRTAFYATLVLSQFVHVFVCKTRFVPMLEHGIFNNSMMNYGWVGGCPMAVFFCLSCLPLDVYI